MNNQNLPNKVDLGGYVMTEEEKKKLRNLPIAVEWRNLCEKVHSGTATAEEIQKYNYELEPYDEMEPNVLYADMPHAEFEKMMREKRAKRLAAEAEAADQKPE